MKSTDRNEPAGNRKNGRGEDRDITEAIHSRISVPELPCAVAFDIAESLGKRPAEVGMTADRLAVRLVKCQLGLFGYSPHKKIVTPKAPDDSNIPAAIRRNLVDDRLPCDRAWEIAKRFGVRKMVVSSACEELGIKIKPCQLGAF